ncbi:hypothetical protein [Crateriforma spongiae]|uniref:hypothetical protein n=1 Tax=Crateriforma spongiae TaxID=2724528 RepID=UPI001447799B|nr:hypothetical protein [Crateriforma spongiae]
MKIDQSATGFVTFDQRRRNNDHLVQNVFDQVLEAAGRDGYASAETPDAIDGQTPGIAEAWDQWYRNESLGRYRQTENRQQLGQTFADVMVQASESAGYVDPIGFLNQLSEDQMETVRQIHALAEPIRVSSLSEEGALNLLLPPAAQIDLDNDGLTESGKAYGIRFPDSQTPPDVVTAWDNATADMDESERMMHMLHMKLPVLTSNAVVKPDGTFSHFRQPGDPDWINPMASEDYSYRGATEDMIDYLNAFRSQIPSDRYERDMAFWQAFRSELITAGVD